MEESTREQWRTLPSHPEYAVSNLGRVANLKSGRLLKVTLPAGINRYPRVHIGRRVQRVHVLVAECFLGPRPPEMDVAHNDGNPANNRADNLRYATRSENIRDAVVHGTKGRKLTFEQVDEIRARWGVRRRYEKPRDGTTVRALAVEYGVSYGMIGRIVRGEKREWAREADHPSMQGRKEAA